DGIRDGHVTGVQTCALPISLKTVLSSGIGPSAKRKTSCHRHAARDRRPRDQVELHSFVGPSQNQRRRSPGKRDLRPRPEASRLQPASCRSREKRRAQHERCNEWNRQEKPWGGQTGLSSAKTPRHRCERKKWSRRNQSKAGSRSR